MDKEIIKSIGLNMGLVTENLHLFIEFFSLRFPNESNKIHSYCREWASRFQGNPKGYMDIKSLSIYNNLLSERSKNEK